MFYHDFHIKIFSFIFLVQVTLIIFFFLKNDTAFEKKQTFALFNVHFNACGNFKN